MTDVRSKKLHLANTDFDTGKMTYAGEYELTDKAYAHLLDRLARDNFAQITPELRENILGFYHDPEAPLATKKNAQEWQKTQSEVERLRSLESPKPLQSQIVELP